MKKNVIEIMISLLMLFLLLPDSANATSQKIKILKATASSVENGNMDMGPDKSFDGDLSTRWASEWKDPQWIYFDLGKPILFNFMTIQWESAFTKEYDIQVSDDASTWHTVFSENNGDGKTDIIKLGNQNARYVKIFCKTRGTSWGNSIFEVSIIFADKSPPAPPSNLSVMKGDGLLVLNWTKNSEADVYAYNIYRSLKQDRPLTRINFSPIEECSFLDKDVVNGKSYFYSIKAVDFLGNESPLSEKLSASPESISLTNTYLDTNLSIEKRVADLLSRMTVQEKVEQTAGIPGMDDMTTFDNKRLGIPSIKCSDGPWGVRWGNATAFPVSIAMASTWEPELENKIGIAMAKELKTRGRNQSLGPCLNIARDPRGGRVHEGFGEDPYLVSRMAVADIKGVQSQNVIATPKHFACNNIERGRDGGRVSIDERTLREIYLPAFKACIQEGQAWSIMGAYNKVNSEYCCANTHLLREILKDEWGFKGFVISDWFGTHNSTLSANGGLDLEMPYAKYFGTSLLEKVKNGEVSEKRIDDMAGRILRIKFISGLFDHHEKVMTKNLEQENRDLALEAARKAIVLLKNSSNLLPLDRNKIKKIAIMGPQADKTMAGEGLGSGQVTPSYFVTPLAGIKYKLGSSAIITDTAEGADVVLYFAGLTESIGGRLEGEGTDRDYLHLPGKQDQAIKDLASKYKNIVVILVGGSAITMDQWIDQVPSIVQAWYCGQEGGNAIADILFGDVNPAGRLPLTFPKSISQLPPFDWNYRDEYKTGVGYCYFDKKGIEPLFPFGYGLSYTKFEYSNLKTDSILNSDGMIKVSLDVKNIGARSGDEVVQLYIQNAPNSVERPLKQLKAFKRIAFNPGEKKTITFSLKPRDLAFYDKNMRFVLEPGTYKLQAGASSRDIRLKSDFTVNSLITNL